MPCGRAFCSSPGALCLLPGAYEDVRLHALWQMEPWLALPPPQIWKEHQPHHSVFTTAMEAAGFTVEASLTRAR